uniref:Sulfotransferase domain-containing protein n=1 Tax=Parascaris equorum TaxID=6256 RepID=A0A914RRP8_PAREQ
MESSKIRAIITIICLVLSLVVLINVSYMGVKVATTPVSESPLYGQYDIEYMNIFISDSSPLPPPSPAQRRTQRLPQCLIIGARKGGTRALLDALALHPQIRVARREVHFFNNNETYAKGIEWYRLQMPYTHAEQRAYRMNSSMKLILIIRDPVIRTISDFTQVMYTKQERNKTKPEFEKEAFLNDGLTIDIEYKPVRNSLYILHLKRWLNYFPLKNFLIIDGDRFIIDPIHELRKVERFLQIPNAIDEDQMIFNERKGFYCFRRKDRRNAKCLGNTKGRPHANISLESQIKLRRNFHPYNVDFFRTTNQWWNWE